MSDAERGQVPGRAAEVDDALFVPAPFAEWPPRMAAAACVLAGGTLRSHRWDN